MEKQRDYHELLKRLKVCQLITLSVIDIAFFLTIIINEELRERIFSNPAVLVLSIFTWAMILVGIIFIVFDFNLLRSIDKESHDLARLAYLDSLTGIPNRYSCDLVLDQYDTPESVRNISCVLMEISNIHEVNEKYGRKGGDRIMRDFSRILEGIGDSYGFIGRNGGNEFICVINDSTRERLHDFLNKTEDAIKEYNTEHEDAPIVIRSASVHNPDAHMDNLNSIIARVYGDLNSRAH